MPILESAQLAAITVEELDDWLRGLDCSPKTRMNFRANVGVLFSYAERRRMIDSNPILRTARPKLIDKAPEIFSVDELTALLNAALSKAPDVVPMLAIGAFAGLREAEIKRLDWAEIDLRRELYRSESRQSKNSATANRSHSAESRRVAETIQLEYRLGRASKRAQKARCCAHASPDCNTGRKMGCATALPVTLWLRRTMRRVLPQN